MSTGCSTLEGVRDHSTKMRNLGFDGSHSFPLTQVTNSRAVAVEHNDCLAMVTVSQ
jgi:hypothetical protein